MTEATTIPAGDLQKAREDVALNCGVPIDWVPDDPRGMSDEDIVTHVEARRDAARAAGNVSQDAPPDAPPPEEAIREVMARIHAVSVADLLELTARQYRARLDADPEDIVRSAGYAYLAERCQATADLFRDQDDPSRCALEGKAIGVDLVRGLRVLALRHPIPEGREMAAAIANAACMALSARVDGIPVDMEPILDTPGGVRATMTIWYEQVMRASRSAHQIQKSGGRISSPGGLAIVGKPAQVRARLVVEMQMQGMGELGILIAAVGLLPAEELPGAPARG